MVAVGVNVAVGVGVAVAVAVAVAVGVGDVVARTMVCGFPEGGVWGRAFSGTAEDFWQPAAAAQSEGKHPFRGEQVEKIAFRFQAT
jgi:hypothetical protein